MKIAVDYDGVLAREFVFTNKLPQWLFKVFSIFAPAMPFVAVLRALARVHEVIVITSRSSEYLTSIRAWLFLHRISVQHIICTGNTCSKREELATEKPNLFIDDKQKHVDEARELGIRAVHFISWRDIAGNAREYGLDCLDTLPHMHRAIATSRIGKRLKHALFRWVAQIPAAQREWARLLDAHLEQESARTVCVNGEELTLYTVRTPFTAYHVTTANTAQEILRNDSIRPSRIYSRYADKARNVEVLFMYALLRQAQRFALFSCWPYRFVVDFLTEEKTTILAITIPAGHLVGMTSWGELVAVEPIEHTRIKVINP